MGKFLDYALKQEAVRFVTYSDLIRWMQVGAAGQGGWQGRVGWAGTLWGGGGGMGVCRRLCRRLPLSRSTAPLPGWVQRPPAPSNAPAGFVCAGSRPPGRVR